MKLEKLEMEVRKLLYKGIENQYYIIDDKMWWGRKVSDSDSSKGVVHSYGANLYLEKIKGFILLNYDIVNTYKDGNIVPEGTDTLLACPYEKDDDEGEIKKFIDKVNKLAPWILD